MDRQLGAAPIPACFRMSFSDPSVCLFIFGSSRVASGVLSEYSHCKLRQMFSRPFLGDTFQAFTVLVTVVVVVIDDVLVVIAVIIFIEVVVVARITITGTPTPPTLPGPNSSLNRPSCNLFMRVVCSIFVQIVLTRSMTMYVQKNASLKSVPDILQNAPELLSRQY